MGRVSPPLPRVAGAQWDFDIDGASVAAGGVTPFEVTFEDDGDVERAWGEWSGGDREPVVFPFEPPGMYRITVEAQLHFDPPPAAPTRLEFEGVGIGLQGVQEEYVIGPDATKVRMHQEAIEGGANLVSGLSFEVITPDDPGLAFTLGVVVILEWLGP